MIKRVRGKIKTLRQLATITQKLKKEGIKIVHCHGVFDLIHPGHIRHLSSAKKYGDVLVITVTADKFVKKGPGRPIFKEDLRAEVLASLEPVDYVAIVESDSANPAIKAIKPDFYVKGPDYKHRKIQPNVPRKLDEETEAVKSVGGKLIFTEDEIVFSSSSLINSYLDVYPERTKKYLDEIREKYSSEYILDKLNSLKDLKILIVGDAIIDEYHYCLPTGKSSKEPIIVHQYIEDESFAGGTLATANHTAALSQNITLVTLLGKRRSFENFIKTKLKPFIKHKFFYQGSFNTVVKRRYIDAATKQKLFQISFLKDQFINKKVEREIIKYLKEEMKKYDLVIVNDFGHGLLTDRIIKTICRQANFLALNVQANSSNYGFNVITKYPKADHVCIDEQEIRLATHDKYSDIKPLIKKIYKKMKSRQMIITRGSEGSIGYTQEDGFIETPALTERVIDRVGAGDALFAFSSPCVYAKFEKDLVGFIGNVAGALQVQTVGNKKPVEFPELIKFINRLLK